MRSKSGPGGTLYHYGLCELTQRQAVLMRKDNLSGRAIKSDRAKVVMTAGCISKNFDIPNCIYGTRDRQIRIMQYQGWRIWRPHISAISPPLDAASHYLADLQ